MEPMLFIISSGFHHIHIDLRYTLDNESCARFIMSSSKTLITRQNFALVHHFVRAQVCPAQQLFPYWQSCGKPSTKLHGGLVECLIVAYFAHVFYFERILYFFVFSIFSKKSRFFAKFLEIWNLMDLALALAFYSLSHPY